ncbi:uncharacterized protein LOC124110689 [Haliotis rufescens]|uniref:uncharacterized protein LOC124110689 n=1 Tax=Haliotis rufescens TaxID=6454 RepID=UPI00201F2F3E|nr:uncharacterized protein LOC124110689 [Haliotis rufescens]
MKELEMEASFYDLDIVDNEGAGNCMFIALAQQLQQHDIDITSHKHLPENGCAICAVMLMTSRRKCCRRIWLLLCLAATDYLMYIGVKEAIILILMDVLNKTYEEVNRGCKSTEVDVSQVPGRGVHITVDDE